MTAGKKHAIADNPKIDDVALHAARLVKARLESRHAGRASLQSPAATHLFETLETVATRIE